MEYYHHTFPNGLRIVHYPTPSPVAYCGFAINAGARDEATEQYGLAHYTEHLLFKGTEKRRPFHILNRMEKVGGELNAYTTKEDTFVYSIFMEEHFDRAAELLTDIVFHSLFPQSEVEKELDVVLDEINSYKDNPSELIFDDFENLLFESHPLGHNILGEEQTIPTFTSDTIKTFTQRLYSPDEIVFFSYGKRDFKKVLNRMQRLTSDLDSRTSALTRKAPEGYTPKRVEQKKETFQCHAMVGNVAYSFTEEKKRRALFLLNNILGGPGMNSRLNLSLRERLGLVYTVESSFASFTDTGLFSVYFGCDHRNYTRCMEGVMREFKQCRDLKLTTSQLNAAKRQMLGQMGVASDMRESQALGLGKAFLRFDRYESIDELFKRIDAVSSSDILEVANEVLDPERLTLLTYRE